MPAQTSESLILRTYPLKEADLIVSFLTRDQGKLRGVANRARRLKSGYGAGLERLTQAQVTYYAKENRELARIDSCELIRACFTSVTYDQTVALDYIAEVSEALLPPHEVNERFFRLIVAVVADIEAGTGQSIWKGLTYFTLWAVRLQGFLPQLQVAEESREIARQMMHTPVSAMPSEPWSKSTAEDLRRALVQLIEEQTERRLVTVRYLETL